VNQSFVRPSAASNRPSAGNLKNGVSPSRTNRHEKNIIVISRRYVNDHCQRLQLLQRNVWQKNANSWQAGL